MLEGDAILATATGQQSQRSGKSAAGVFAHDSDTERVNFKLTGVPVSKSTEVWPFSRTKRHSPCAN